jgi:hypothetical protein
VLAAATVQPGDVLAVRSPGTAGRLIRFGAAMRELVTGQPEPNLQNHIAIMHHVDKAGTLWVLEGRPGGVGWRQADDYLHSPWTLTNAGQPKTAAQRAAVCKTAEAMIGTAYSWQAIVEDAGVAFGLHAVWAQKPGGQVPGHIVCSSLAAFAYDRAGLPAPEPQDYAHVTPADWVAFVIEHGYQGTV